MHYLKLSLLAFTLIFTGCASTIGNVVDITDVQFSVGETNKSEISEVLGFPEHRVVEEEIEYWGYRAKPALSGVVYAFPSGANTVSTYTVTDIHNVPRGMDASAVIYAFDGDGLLVDVHQSKN